MDIRGLLGTTAATLHYYAAEGSVIAGLGHADRPVIHAAAGNKLFQGTLIGIMSPGASVLQVRFGALVAVDSIAS